MARVGARHLRAGLVLDAGAEGGAHVRLDGGGFGQGLEVVGFDGHLARVEVHLDRRRHRAHAPHPRLVALARAHRHARHPLLVHLVEARIRAGLRAQRTRASSCTTGS
eukprot:756216-Prorocentrum_minimum.AAC.4